jgi:hypothetical protein
MKPIDYAPIRSQNQRQQAQRQRELDARRQASSVRKEKKNGPRR